LCEDRDFLWAHVGYFYIKNEIRDV
jgi:hypothetical protein